MKNHIHSYLFILIALCFSQNSFSSLPPHKRLAEQSEDAPQAKKQKLMIAEENSQELLISGIKNQNLEQVKLALQSGAQPDVILPNKSTPLTYATDILNLEIVKELVYAGADVNLIDKFQRTPLTQSICSQPESEPIALFLIENGAQVDLADKFGTPLLFAITNSQIKLAKELISRGAEVNFSHKNHESSLLTQAICANRNNTHDEIIQLLLEEGATIDFVPKHKGTITPISAAISYGNNALAKQFIKNKHVTVCTDLIQDAFESGNEEMAYIILSELNLDDTDKQTAQLNIEHVRFTHGLRSTPAHEIEKIVANTYKIKQMVRAKVVESLELE